jgi:hypothetical protein
MSYPLDSIDRVSDRVCQRYNSLVKEVVQEGTRNVCNAILPPAPAEPAPEPVTPEKPSPPCEITFTPRCSPEFVEAVTEALAEPEPERQPCAISDRRLERAKGLLAKGLGVRAVAAMIDVEQRDLEAALQ